MTLRPTPWTAAAAGVLAALVWPLLWAKFGGSTEQGGFELIVATLVVIALPAHAFVVGFGPSQAAAERRLDTDLLKRIGWWLSAAAGVTLLRGVTGL
ncbi:hypothetical protein [Roseateles paludis]|jgi:uncharacterized YccA/Bax inhibitor family protein|uniref:Uncharacterized protein n=1 Tax=Roseateles paludis TaxID=3145238 RepID=A0ABV0G1I4_9BURK